MRNPAFAHFGSYLVNEIIAPIQKVHQTSIASGREVWSHYIWLTNVETERNELLGRVKSLEEQNSKLLELGSENERLSALLNFSHKTGFRGVTATVIGYDPSNWVRTITIDRGLDDGVRPGLAVVDGHMLVGQTTGVSRRYAKVLLITDTSSAVDALVQRTRARGIVEGGSWEKLRLGFKYVVKDADVQVGDRIITAGLGGVFPKGISLGVIESVQSSENSMFQEIELRPAADFHRLEKVMVILASDEERRDIDQAAAMEDGEALPDLKAGEAKQ